MLKALFLYKHESHLKLSMRTLFRKIAKQRLQATKGDENVEKGKVCSIPEKFTILLRPLLVRFSEDFVNFFLEVFSTYILSKKEATVQNHQVSDARQA